MIRRRTFLFGGLSTAVLAAGGSGAYANLWERHAVRVDRVPLALGLPRPLRLVQLSDLHFDPLCETDYLERVITLAQSLEPDLVCYTGDFASHVVTRFDDFGRIAQNLRGRFGTFATLGNHDHWTGPRQISRVLERAGITVLVNEDVALPGVPGWRLGGIDSYWSGRPSDAFLARRDADTRFILLVHEPDPFSGLTDPRIRLQLSGHTHGGQVRAPFVGALQLPAWGKLYDAGLFRRGDRHLYVNRGIGTVGPAVRFNCPPEITAFDLS